MQYYLAILLGSHFNIGSLYLLFIAYVFFQKIWKLDQSFSTIEWQYLLLFLLGTLSVLLYMNYYDEGYADRSSITFNIRKHFIQLFFAIAMYEFFKDKELKYVIDTLYFSLLPNILIGTYQLISSFPHRINMLFPEPSAAGYYYLFIFFILISKFDKGIAFWTTRYFMILGLAIGSKAQIILLSIVGLLKYSTPLKLSLFLSSIGLLFYNFSDEILNIEAINYNLGILKIYWEQGLSGLRFENGVWGTYVTRISSIQGAFICISEHPFGIGFGGFNSWYSSNMINLGFSSPETDAIIYGGLYASPKSNLLDFFVITGVFGIGLYLFWLNIFIKFAKTQSYLLQSFIALSFASLFIELNPMYVYFMILFILKEKEEQILFGEKNET